MDTVTTPDFEVTAAAEGDAMSRMDSYRVARPSTYRRASLTAVPAGMRAPRRDRRPLVERLRSPVVAYHPPPDWLAEILGNK